jgi:hypothetical protein
MGGQSTTQTFLLVVLLAAIAGVAAMAVIDVALTARYAMVNRSLAKRAASRTPKPPRDAP